MGFPERLAHNGVLDRKRSEAPNNLQDRKDQLHLALLHALPEMDYEAYVREVETLGDKLGLFLAANKLLESLASLSYRRQTLVVFNAIPSGLSFNRKLPMPKADFVEGLTMDAFPTFSRYSMEQSIIVQQDGSKAKILPHLAGILRPEKQSRQEAMARSAYAGAALVWTRHEALALLGRSDPPKHAAVSTFIIDGTSVEIFAHYAAVEESGKTVYHQYSIGSSGLTSSVEDLERGRRMLKNLQAFAEEQAVDLGREVLEYMKQRRRELLEARSCRRGRTTAAPIPLDEDDARANGRLAPQAPPQGLSQVIPVRTTLQSGPRDGSMDANGLATQDDNRLSVGDGALDDKRAVDEPLVRLAQDEPLEQEPKQQDHAQQDLTLQEPQVEQPQQPQQFEQFEQPDEPEQPGQSPQSPEQPPHQVEQVEQDDTQLEQPLHKAEQIPEPAEPLPHLQQQPEEPPHLHQELEESPQPQQPEDPLQISQRPELAPQISQQPELPPQQPLDQPQEQALEQLSLQEEQPAQQAEPEPPVDRPEHNPLLSHRLSEQPDDPSRQEGHLSQQPLTPPKTPPVPRKQGSIQSKTQERPLQKQKPSNPWATRSHKRGKSHVAGPFSPIHYPKIHGLGLTVPVPAATGPAATGPAATGPAATGPAVTGPAAPPTPSKRAPIHETNPSPSELAPPPYRRTTLPTLTPRPSATTTTRARPAPLVLEPPIVPPAPWMARAPRTAAMPPPPLPTPPGIPRFTPAPVVRSAPLPASRFERPAAPLPAEARAGLAAGSKMPGPSLPSLMSMGLLPPSSAAPTTAMPGPAVAATVEAPRQMQTPRPMSSGGMSDASTAVAVDGFNTVNAPGKNVARTLDYHPSGRRRV
jgi:hypothetical protein